MMGVINEDKRSDFIQKMIDNIGIVDTIKYYGGHEQFLRHIDGNYFSRDGKIKIIEGLIKEKFGWLLRYGDGDWDEDTYDVLEKTDTYKVVVFTYEIDSVEITTFFKDENGMYNGQQDDDTIYYKDLREDFLNKIFEYITTKH